MKLIYTLFFFWLCLFSQASAQNLTGIWRGYFVQQAFDMLTGQFKEDRYKYEIQINNLSSNALEGVTYSYKTTVFYGKAKMHGIYNAKTKNIVLKESKMLDLKITDGSEACIMTCYLDYTKEGKKETLSGTYISVNNDKKTDCGNGTVYLERVKNTDFEKEPFLFKKYKPLVKKGATNTPPAVGNLPKKNIPVPFTNKKPNVNIGKKNISTAGKKMVPLTNNIKKQLKPGAEAFVQNKINKVNNAAELTVKNHEQTDSTLNANATASATPNMVQPHDLVLEVPKVLLERKNELAKKLIVNAQLVTIEYFDNGQIDNDSITVYHNNKIEIDGARLSYTPIRLQIQLDAEHPLHEIITVANNLGNIPPNTALMVITAGKNKYEVFITSDKKKNAKVVLEYNPKGDAGVIQ